MNCNVLRCVLCNESTVSLDPRLAEWVESQRLETAPLFFGKLLDVEDSAFADRLAVGGQLVDCKCSVDLQLNQIWHLHHAVYCNADVWNADNGNQHLPILDVLDRLEGDAPYEYLTEDGDKVMPLDLAMVDAAAFNPFFADNVSESGRDDVMVDNVHLDHDRLLQEDASYIQDVLQCVTECDDEIAVIQKCLKQLLLEGVCPEHIVREHRHSVGALLGALKEWAVEEGEDAVSCLVDDVLGQMTRYQAENAEHGIEGLNDFVAESHSQIRSVLQLSRRLQSKAVLFAKARDTMVDHGDYLQNKLAEREQMLEAEKTSLSKRKQSRKTIKVPFKKLVGDGVIIEDGRSGLDGAVFHFAPQSADSFLVQIKLRSRLKSKSAPRVDAPFVLSLMAVLELRESNRMQFELQSFTFYVDGAIEFLNGILRNRM